jgi:hypothetical protein
MRDEAVKAAVGWTEARSLELRAGVRQAVKQAVLRGLPRERMSEFITAVSERQVDLMLTQEEKTNWKALLGSPFKFTFTREQIRDGTASPSKKGDDTKPDGGKGSKSPSGERKKDPA